MEAEVFVLLAKNSKKKEDDSMEEIKADTNEKNTYA